MEYCNSRIVERNGKTYRVTIIEHCQVMPWGTEEVCFSTAKWELLERQQMDLFDV